MNETKDMDIMAALDDGSHGSFRERANRVGVVYTMTYDRATVAVYDFDREKAGGLPKGGFLVAAKQTGDESFVLLRVLKEARLPNAAANDLVRQQGVESTANDKPWSEALDEWMRNQVSLHAVECRLLGTFQKKEDGEYAYAEDTDNYYAVHDLMVWKPDPKTLDLIINHRHRANPIAMGEKRRRVGRIRFAAAERPKTGETTVKLDPTDLLRRRTVYLGMSRSGKSNAMKITAEAIYRLRESDPDHRIGQLIFDPNGEYAQDNPQDGAGLHRIHETLGLARKDEVETYGLFPTESDPERWIMKINFFGEPLPSHWSEEEVEDALEQLLAGRDIIREIMADEIARYTTAFRDADLSIPPSAASDYGTQTRYKRAVLCYRTALSAAGLAPPNWQPSIQGLFSDDIIDALKQGANPNSANAHVYGQAATALATAKANGGQITWSTLTSVFSALNQFIADGKSNYAAFENKYIATSSSGESWADPRLKNLLRIFETQNGPRSFQRAQDQHDAGAPNDFAANVIEDLCAGKLVIVDQSTGDPKQNEKAAERIMWRVFRKQQESFRNAAGGTANPDDLGHILVYVEEAHNLLPRANAADKLSTVWARAAKEGSKMNIGMVLSTQAPSSIMPEILSETDNWILAYLNSRNERNVISAYMDFEDFLDQIGQVSEPGFVRLRTLSLAYTIPVQFDHFKLDLESSTSVDN